MSKTCVYVLIKFPKFSWNIFFLWKNKTKILFASANGVCE